MQQLPTRTKVRGMCSVLHPEPPPERCWGWCRRCTASAAAQAVEKRCPPIHEVLHPPLDAAGYGTTDSSSEPSNDVGLIALASPCGVTPVRLPEADGRAATRQLAVPQPAAGAMVWAAGFGVTENGDTSDVLRYTDLTVYADQQCPPAFSDNFCAGGQSGFTCQVCWGAGVLGCAWKGENLGRVSGM